jgi:type II secretory pathway pseudopilin PulG
MERNPTFAAPGRANPGQGAGRRRAGLTLVELLLVTGILFLLAAILLVTLGPARKMARIARCTSHLRQIGMAYGMYHQDYGQYPGPWEITQGTYVRDNRILFCPEDTTIAVTGAASSYRFRDEVPPDFTPLSGVSDLDPRVVLAGCQHHLGQQVVVLKGDNTRLTPPQYPFHLVLRAGGTVDRIHLSHVRKFFQAGEEPVLQTLYPGEPGYESGKVMASVPRP